MLIIDCNVEYISKIAMCGYRKLSAIRKPSTLPLHLIIINQQIFITKNIYIDDA